MGASDDYVGQIVNELLEGVAHAVEDAKNGRESLIRFWLDGQNLRVKRVDMDEFCLTKKGEEA